MTTMSTRLNLPIVFKLGVSFLDSSFIILVVCCKLCDDDSVVNVEVSVKLACILVDFLLSTNITLVVMSVRSVTDFIVVSLGCSFGIDVFVGIDSDNELCSVDVNDALEYLSVDALVDNGLDVVSVEVSVKIVLILVIDSVVEYWSNDTVATSLDGSVSTTNGVVITSLAPSVNCSLFVSTQNIYNIYD